MNLFLRMEIQRIVRAQYLKQWIDGVLFDVFCDPLMNEQLLTDLIHETNMDLSPTNLRFIDYKLDF